MSNQQILRTASLLRTNVVQKYNENNSSQHPNMRYKIRLQKSEEGYAVWCPGLPGCWSQGETEEEALENIKDAIQAYLEVAEELNHDAEARYVEVG